MLEHVSDYDEDIPAGKRNKAGRKWLRTFVHDFTFSLTNETDSDGKVVRKVDQGSRIGRKFKAIHDLNVEALLKENAEHTYSEPLPIPSIEAEHFNKEFFTYWKKHVNMPLVIKGYLKGAKILEEATKEGFTKLNGEREVRCLSTIAKDASTVGQNLELSTTTLKDFLSSPEYDGYYINNFYGILNDEDFLAKCRGKEIDTIQGKSNILTQWFISRSSGTGSTLHCAAGDNMFLNIKGQKEWYFIDRTYTPVLQPSLSKYAVYAISELHEDLEGDFYADIMSMYDFLKHVPIHKCVLEEGDVLFNPPFWWHRVKNLTNYTVGCATRYWATVPAAHSLAFTLGVLIDAVKHPMKSSVPTTLRMMFNRNLKGQFIESIFSKK